MSESGHRPDGMHFECRCGMTLSGPTVIDGEVRATVDCEHCGAKYAATISRLTHR